MRLALAVVLCGVALAQAPVPGSGGVSGPGGAPNWRGTFRGLMGRRPGTVNARDLQMLETQLALAGQYCVGLTPGDYEANRAMVRDMMAYLATIQVASGDEQMNLSMRRLRGSLAAFPCAYALPPGAPPPGPAAAPPPRAAGEPPFALQAPALTDVKKEDQETAKELRERYAGVASRAASTWKNAETIRLGLVAKGMSLNADTQASVDHLKLFLDQATEALNQHDWMEAGEALDRCEFATQKVAKTVGN